MSGRSASVSGIVQEMAEERAVRVMVSIRVDPMRAVAYREWAWSALCWMSTWCTLPSDATLAQRLAISVPREHWLDTHHPEVVAIEDGCSLELNT